jgi:DNA helicase-2/ATP-dependent DNA helicase PcrA
MIAEANRNSMPVDAQGLRTSARVYADYQRRLRDANAADFGDLLLWPARAMQRSESYRTRWASRFDCVVADEFQDVNFAQFTWLRLLAAAHGEIFVVGDDDQSVYGWRGADVGYIRRFTRDFPNAAVYRLEENFRSTGHILSAANTVIAQDPARLGKTLFTRKPSGDPVEIVRFRNGEAEASGMVSEITRRHAEGLAWDDMAILYRSNALSRGLEEALMRARVPYALIGDVGFYQRAEIKDALALLRLATTPDDAQADEALRRVINVPARGFGAKAMDILEAEAAWRRVPLLVALETAPLPPKARAAGLGFVDAIRRVGQDCDATLADQLSMLLDATGYRSMLRESRAEATEGRLENLQELVQLAGGFNTARELLDHAALSTGGPDEEETGRVQLMTLHKAKGLEFPHVFLPAWEAGVFPPDYGDPAEERRLAYVAITRGMSRVTISHCDYRRGPATPSLFIDDIPDRHRVPGWLHQLGATPVPVRRKVGRLNAAELLQRF